jgi:HAD superfamily hydrolase (TIGR01509 family)
MEGQMSAPIRVVLFDLHQTLVDGGDAMRWLDLAWRHLGNRGRYDANGGPPAAELAAWLEDVWDHAALVDPDAARDLDAAAHRRVFHETVGRVAGVDPAFVAALYATLPEALTAYADAEPTLRALAAAGVRTAVLSNIGFDVRPLLARSSLLERLDAVVLSFEVGHKKPDPAIFHLALERLDADPAETLMVGDSWRDDAAAGALGIRTLVLPRTRGPVHGLDAVRRLVGC